MAEAPIGKFWHVITLDLFRTFLGCRDDHPVMIESGGGAFINTAPGPASEESCMATGQIILPIRAA